MHIYAKRANAGLYLLVRRMQKYIVESHTLPRLEKAMLYSHVG